VSWALAAYAAGEGSEHAALTALAASRLLVPVVADVSDREGRGDGGEKAAEMALPTLIGLDGRRAIPAFTSLATMARWRADARPVPAPSLGVWQAAAEDSCAVVIDVGGPVPFAVEGARLAALARGEGPPEPWGDPDVREAVAGVLAGRLAVGAFDLRPGGADHDMVIALSLAPGRQPGDIAALAQEIGDAVFTRLGGRLRRGVAIWLGAAG
jgi:SseB protein N-terminal domain